MVEEDLTLRVRRDTDTNETVLSGIGESHLEVAADKMQRKFGVGVTLETREWLFGLPAVKAPGLGRSARYVPVTVGEVFCHVHFNRNKKTVELMAPVNLCDTFGLTLGDKVEIRCTP